MNPHSDIFASENLVPNNSNESLNGDVGGRRGSSEGSVEGASTLSAGSKFPDVFQLKQELLGDLPAARISEIMFRDNSLESTSMPSLFSALNKTLDESIEKKRGDIPQSVASLLKVIVQEIEQRILKQAEDWKKRNNVYKSRQEKFQSRIKVLETLATGTTDEYEVAMNQLHQMKIEKNKIEEKKKLEEQDVMKLMKEKESNDIQISVLKQELEQCRRTHEEHCLQLESEAKENKHELEKKIEELQCLLNDSRKKVKELETFSESKILRLKRKEHGYRSFIDFHSGALKELRVDSESIKQEILKTKNIYSEEFNNFGMKLKKLIDAAQNYHSVLAENRKLYNEVQDLKGNIRVYCRIRPFLPGQSKKQTTIKYIGENGELVVENPSKQGKDNHRLFKFNKVFSPAASQEEVFLDTQPLVRSVLDGYNVCIFAYGQTGSGKTYTMTGPNASSEEDWGVNYRALNDLFHISQNRISSFSYEIGVQMVEIYNEQVRDLLISDNSQKRLGIWNTAHSNGLAVPDASMYPVKSTSDVLELMNIGLTNRAVGATALNERSSRSHSILTVHVRGTDMETNDVLRGSLHLVDLAGSERVDRSKATGDRLREAQHINKSLSALGDVIFALAQKSPHVPYRNSKLTQVLQSSLGGQAKTLMFVQLNPDVESYSETTSTLKFAERVSGVELGAARSNKEGRGVRELMEQVGILKETIAKKDEEIGRLRLLRTHGSGDRLSMGSPRYSSSSPIRRSTNARQQSRTPSGSNEKHASDFDNSSELSDKHSEAGSQQSMDDFGHQKEFLQQSRLAVGDRNLNEDVGSKVAAENGCQSNTEDVELLGFGDDSEERLSDISDGVLSMGTETDGSMNSIVEFTLFPETSKPPAENTDKAVNSRPSVPAKLPRPPQKQAQKGSSRLSATKLPLKASSFKKPAVGSSSSSSSSATKPSKRWQ